MANYNSQLQSNNTDLQTILNIINELPEAGGNPVLQDKTITPTTSKQTITADSGYDGLDTVTVNAMPTATQATPTITVNSSTGLITATATQNAGYVAAGTKSATKQLAFQAAQTITPGTTNKTIAANTYLGGVQTIKGDANLIAENIKNGTSIFGVTGTYEGSGGGDTSIEDSLVTRTVANYINDRVTSIGPNAFYSCAKLTTVSFLAATSIGPNAFRSCTSLTTANFPAAIYIGSSAFRDCAKLTTISFPAAISIRSSAFFDCAGLTTISFPAATSIGSAAFSGCVNLTTANFPAATFIGAQAFYSCAKLTTISFPAAISISTIAFRDCAKLTTISFPAATFIGAQAFYSCTNLSKIYLGASTRCALSNSNAFSKTGIWSTKGSIFVPASLLASYKAATNWVFFSNRIFSYAF